MGSVEASPGPSCGPEATQGAFFLQSQQIGVTRIAIASAKPHVTQWPALIRGGAPRMSTMSRFTWFASFIGPSAFWERTFSLRGCFSPAFTPEDIGK